MNDPHPVRGQIGYLQLPALDVARSAAFYREVAGWSVDPDNGGFTAPGMIGQLTEELPVGAGGPVVWVCVDDLFPTLTRVGDHGGRVRGRPVLDGGERWLVEVDDPAGNRVGLVAPVRAPRSQTMIAVRDVEASSRWYQHLLGLRSDHGGAEYERLLADGTLVLQLHQNAVAHHHGAIGGPDSTGGPVGRGVLLWFGEVSDFDDAVARAAELGAAVVREPHRNPPEGEGPSHREIWVEDPDGYTVVIASPDGESFGA
jgi:predicted enzyme related to lactoylglutathione lyase